MLSKGRFPGIGFLALFIFLSLTITLEAQSARSYSELHIAQRLSWPDEEDLLYYQVIIERQEDEVYIEIISEITYTKYIEITLSPGYYRFRVIPHDIQNKPGRESQWYYAEVRPAIRPEVYDISPRRFNFFSETQFTLNIHGKNIDPNAVIYLQRPYNESINPIQTYISEDGDTARLVFERGQLNPWVYELFINNPGLDAKVGTINFIQQAPDPETEPSVIAVFTPINGQQSLPEPVQQDEQIETDVYEEPVPFELPEPVQSIQEIVEIDEPVEEIEEEKKYDVFIGVSWTPLFFITGDNNKYFSSNPVLIGASLRRGLVTAGPGFLNFGMELTLAWNMFDTNSAVTLGINLLLQKWFLDNTLAARMRLGPSYSLLFGDFDDFEFPDMDSISINAGLSVLWKPGNSFYVEAGIDYSFMPPNANAIKPWIGIGLRF